MAFVLGYPFSSTELILDSITAALVFGYIAISGYFSAIAIVVVLMMALYAIQVV